jgi:signal transduction histidine kinase/CheY-like chemotaxis protein
MPLSSQFRVNAGLALAMLLVLAAGALSIVSTDRAFRIGERTIQSQELVGRLNALLANLESAGTSQRGYLLTGDSSYRNDFAEAEVRAEEELRALAALRGSEARSSEIDAVRQLAGRRLDLLQDATRTFEQDGFEAATAVVRSGVGSRVMDSLRRKIHDIESTERAELVSSARQGVISERATRGLLLLMVVLGVGVIAAAVFLVNRDMENRIRTESDLRKAVAAADAANRAKSDFLATVSHEIRTPLNAILGMTELLRETKLSTDQEEFSRTVHSNAEALVAMVGDLLDSFKIEAGQIDLEQVPFDVREVVEGVGEILMVRAEARDVDLAVHVHPDVPRQLVGDSNRLRQILLNLVSNAIKFTEKGEVSMVAIASPMKDGRWELVLRVLDTGIGIAPEAQERIFEPFVQAESSTTRRFGGTGLGLNIVRSLVNLMGGTVALRSEVGKGSLFTVTVPLDPDPSVTVPRADLRGVEVALLSENGLRLSGIQAVLGSADATVRPARHPDELLAMLRERPAAVVIIDETRAYSARDFASTLHDLHVGTRVIVLCGLQSPLVSEGGADAVECLFKPLREARLVDAVARAAGRSTPRSRQAAPATPQRVRSGPPPRVLVAEDNFGNWLLAMRALTSAGYGAEHAPNGQVAVDMAAEREYDLILMDIEMPVLDGLEATRLIRRLEQEERRDPVPIVAVTAHALEGFRDKCIIAGMDDYATKPIKPAHLVELAEQWVDPRSIVAVADDAPENHVLIRHFLRGEPFRVVSAHTGREAISVLRRRRVSVLLLDMDMPEVDGYQAIAEIRRDHELRALPVIAITGYTGADERTRCLAAGCTDYLAKPFRRPELVSALRNALATPAVVEPLGRETHRAGRPDGAQAASARRTSSAPEAQPQLVSRATDADPDRLLRERVGRIVRLLNRRDFAASLPLAAELRQALLGANDRGVLQLARELETAVAKCDEQSAVFWSSRVTAALQERQRLRRLHETGLLDSPPEARYDRLVHDVARRLNVPTALISLVDVDRQFFKSQFGVGEPFASGRGTPLSYSFCQHVVSAAEPLIIEDARDHPIVRDNLAVPELGVVAYAGVPLLTDDGFPMGSLCAIDIRPRKWTEEELDVLRSTAKAVEAEMRTPDSRLESPHPGAAPVDDDPAADPELAAFARMFLRDRAEDAAKVEQWLASESWKEIIRLGHQLKGSAATFGFPKVGEIGGRLETAARAGDSEQVLAERNTLLAQLENHRRDG